MTCYKPWLNRETNKNIPCGGCIGCRLSRARQWAVRCMHEAQYHDENSFITLTYDEYNLPPGGSLDPQHFVKFMKRLRKSLEPKKIRFYHCGEYGDQLGRPHYHALIFGHSFPDKKSVGTTKSGEEAYRSESLDKLWGHGFCQVGNVTVQSAQYCSAYIMKKIGGKMAPDHYRRFDQDSGEVFNLHPEYSTMSRMPGIGHQWFQDFEQDAFPSDFIIMDGKKSAVPKYYDKLLKKRDRDQLDDVKKSRRKKTMNKEFIRHTSPARLAVREEVTKARTTLHKRDL